MNTTQRSQDIFEDVGDYPKPPLIPLPEPGDLESMERMGIVLNHSSRLIIYGMFRLSGFNTWYKVLPDHLEDILRTNNQRVPGLFLPLISATLTLIDDPRSMTPAQRAATLIFGARRLYEDLLSGKFPADTLSGKPLEMGQYPNLFSTSLVIENKRVRMYKSAKTTQITVVANRKFYILEIGDLGKETGFEQLTEAIDQLIRYARQNPLKNDEPPAGYLSAASHDTQLRVFPKLQQMPINQASLNALRESFLTLCLDTDYTPNDDAEAAKICHSGNLANRWFHSSLQIVVFGNSKASLICNFTTYLDGNTMMRGASEIYQRAIQQPLSSDSVDLHPSLPEPKVLTWRIPPEVRRQCRQDLALVLDQQPATFELDGIGKKAFIERKIEPVPTFIAALQMTTNRLTNQPGKITQFLTLTRYRCMDLTTAVVSTNEVLEFANYMNGKTIDPAKSQEYLRTAIESQVQVSRKARKYLNLPIAYSIFVSTLHGLKAWWAMNTYNASLWLLKRMNLFHPAPQEILVSHPEIYPEIPVVGRPGVRLSYLRYYGLHYQILDDKTVITMMPGVPWIIPNVEFIRELRWSLEQILGIF